MAGENAAGKRVIGKPVAGILLCIAVAASSSSVSLAGSPEFAYTAEQWASFRDNKLEFDEIVYLIHEYNNTVIQNQIEYKEYRGETRDDISQDYYDAADDVYAVSYTHLDVYKRQSPSSRAARPWMCRPRYRKPLPPWRRLTRT